MIPLKRTLIPIVAVVLACTAASQVSAAFITYNATGTWTGGITCKSSLGGVKQKVTLTPTMQVTQLGLDLGVQLTVGNTTTLYVGLANPDAKKPEQKGELALILCGTDSVLAEGRDEIGRMTVSTKAGKVKATIKGVSYFSNPGDFPAEAGVCKWKWTRIDTTNANLGTECPGPTLHLPPTATR